MIRPLISDFIDSALVIAGFTTRAGGVSCEPYDFLNLGMSTGDDKNKVSRNRSLLYDYAGIHSPDAAVMHQIHETTVTVVTEGGQYPDTDGLITATPIIMLCVQTADCVPLLLHDPSSGTVAALHCGWRPLTAGIIDNAIDIMTRSFASEPRYIRALYGPGAGPCCYEVGSEVVARFHRDSIQNRHSSHYADIPAEIRTRLLAAGLTCDNIHGFNNCTICHHDHFYSYRRDGEKSGRMMGFIRLKGETE